jgi:hypothetical protein
MIRPKALLCGLTGAVMMTGTITGIATPAFAGNELLPHKFEVGVVNSSQSKINVRFIYSGEADLGRVKSEDYTYNGKTVGKLPSDPVSPAAIEPGGRSSSYAFEVPGNEHDAGYLLEVSRADDPQDRTVAKFYRWKPARPIEPCSEQPFPEPFELTDQKGTSLKVSLDTSITARPDIRPVGGCPSYSKRYPEYDDSGFMGHMRIVVTEAHGHMKEANETSRVTEKPYPAPWEMDTTIGQGGWTALDDKIQRWQLKGLTPNADYWFRCYDPTVAELSFNGYKPKASEVGGGETSGVPAGFWATSDENGTVSVLRTESKGPASGLCDVHVAVKDRQDAQQGTLAARRITGTSTEDGVNKRPIYKFTIPERHRIFDEAVPAMVRIPPYLVEGKNSQGEWVKVGTVLPASATKVDDAKREVIYGGATFYFQNKTEGAISKLRVSGGFGGNSNEIDLEKLPLPKATLKGTSIDLFINKNRSAVPVSLEANGEVQQKLDIQIDRDGRSVDATDPMYDNVYYRDDDGLVTGMYNKGGGAMVSDEQGATPNPAQGSVSGMANSQAVYLSANHKHGGEGTVYPLINLDEKAASQNRFDYNSVKPSSVLRATNTTLDSGLMAYREAPPNGAFLPVAVPDSRRKQGGLRVPAVYRLNAAGENAVDRPFTVVVNRYMAITATPTRDFPLKNLQKGNISGVEFDAYANSLSGEGLGAVEGDLTITAVTAYGTRVSCTAPAHR